MAATEYLRIDVEAQTRDAKKGLNEVAQSIEGVGAASRRLAPQMEQAAASVKKSTSSYTNLGRVIQDLPYGFNGVANNLTQLIPSVGALGLAFSGVVTAITFAQVGFGAWTRGMGDSKKKTDEAAEATKRYTDDLAKEKVTLDTLYKTATNANQPLEVRKNAVKTLINDYGNYLKGFSEEEIMAGKAATAYNALSAAIIKVARAKAASEEITRLQSQALQDEIKMAEVAKKTQEAASKATAIKAGGTNIGGYQKFTSAQDVQADIFARGAGEAKKYADAIVEAAKRMDYLAGIVQDNQTKPFSISGKNGEEKLDREAILFKQYLADHKQYLTQKKQEAALAVGGGMQPINTTLASPFVNQNAQVGQIAEKYKNLVTYTDIWKDELSQAGRITDVVAGSFNQIISGIQRGMSLGESLGNVFKDLAAQIAIAAAKAAIFSVIANALTGGTYGAASSGGGFLKSLGSIFGFANGGIVNKPTLSVVGERGESEAIMPLGRLSGMLNMAANIGANSGGGGGNFVIRGQDLVLVNQRANFNLNLRR